ncbi:MAG: pyridoxamine 5'-phosphate oxidase family protein [Anaerolineae bacterium]|nr:pyridoxamine 5'-phosphate oxidase family protein [Anaerolineae bacterium]
MTERQPLEAIDSPLWQTVPELPLEVFTVLRQADSVFNPVAIIATLDPEGTPHTAPFGSLRAVTTRSLRFLCYRAHNTYANLCRDGRIAITVVSPPGVAVSIRGRARVIREQMDVAQQYALVAVDIDQVKNNMVGLGIIKNVIPASPAKNTQDWFANILGERDGV